MAFGIRIPGTSILGVPDPAPAAVLPPDGTAGVIALFEPGHPLSTKTGVPVTGESFNDIAGAFTRLTLGVTEAPSLVVTNTVNNSGNQALVERTAKGGLHVASAHTSASTPYQNFLVGGQAARKTYIDARAAAGDTFYVSLWARVTRPPKSGYATGYPTAAIRKGLNLSDLLAAAGFSSGAAWHWPQTGTGYVGGQSATSGTASFVGVAGKLGTPAAFNSSLNLVSLGALNAGTLNVLGAEIVYRAYFENLTSTGRAYETVRKADFFEYTDQVLTPGGRYYGDTWTEPTSRVP